MNDIIDTIPLSRGSRLIVRQDPDAQPPRGGDWGALTGFVKIDGMGDSRRYDPPAVHEPPIPLERMFNALRWRRGAAAHTDVMYRRTLAAVEQTQRWAVIFADLHVVFDHEHGGFWFRHYEDDESGDRTDQLDTIATDRALYKTWAEGGVYEVVLQREQRYVAVIDSGSDFIADDVDWGSEITQWEDVDGGALAGCYLDDEYTAQTVAIDHFPLTADELAAARGQFPAGDLHDSPLAAE